MTAKKKVTFAQFCYCLKRKAKLRGIHIIVRDPLTCRYCGLSLSADFNAAKKILSTEAVNKK
jgi:transposase